MKTQNIWSITYNAIEKRIAEKVAEIEEAGYEVDPWELEDIKAEAYAEFGWEYTPEEEEDNEEEEEKEEEYHYRSIDEQLRELGMSWSDFM